MSAELLVGNWKLVSWGDVAAGLDLVIDTAYDPRASQSVIVTDAVPVAVVVIVTVGETEVVPVEV